jgi:hypothetical protein
MEIYYNDFWVNKYLVSVVECGLFRDNVRIHTIQHWWQMNLNKYGKLVEWQLATEKWSTCRETCSKTTLCIKNPILTALKSNMGFHTTVAYLKTVCWMGYHIDFKTQQFHFHYHHTCIIYDNLYFWSHYTVFEVHSVIIQQASNMNLHIQHLSCSLTTENYVWSIKALLNQYCTDFWGMSWFPDSSLCTRNDLVSWTLGINIVLCYISNNNECTLYSLQEF